MHPEGEGGSQREHCHCRLNAACQFAPEFGCFTFATFVSLVVWLIKAPNSGASKEIAVKL